MKNKQNKALYRGLLELAAQARELAYAPYSNYQVGAAVVGKSGKIYTGCNIENASYGLTVCAERNAIFKGVTEGEKEFVALAVVTTNVGSPCGACRQVASEFMQPNTPVILSDDRLEKFRIFSLADLLPDGFTPQRLREGQGRRQKKDRKTTKL
ncbi:MAG: cytidine deaminase [Chloroflexi bacterium]|nr:cytidine deaminase [Chloroflexota bacterium]